uniref:Dipeptidylpeptidase IV N-terminal domain-containing protein n=1 Tax=Ananas comosus var. bracteatus TaxID=296719 RepID=A0A6V7QVU5_ANACO
MAPHQSRLRCSLFFFFFIIFTACCLSSSSSSPRTIIFTTLGRSRYAFDIFSVPIPVPPPTPPPPPTTTSSASPTASPSTSTASSPRHPPPPPALSSTSPSATPPPTYTPLLSPPPPPPTYTPPPPTTIKGGSPCSSSSPPSPSCPPPTSPSKTARPSCAAAGTSSTLHPAALRRPPRQLVGRLLHPPPLLPHPPSLPADSYDFSPAVSPPASGPPSPPPPSPSPGPPTSTTCPPPSSSSAPSTAPAAPSSSPRRLALLGRRLHPLLPPPHLRRRRRLVERLPRRPPPLRRPRPPPSLLSVRRVTPPGFHAFTPPPPRLSAPHRRRHPPPLLPIPPHRAGAHPRRRRPRHYFLFLFFFFLCRGHPPHRAFRPPLQPLPVPRLVEGRVPPLQGGSTAGSSPLLLENIRSPSPHEFSLLRIDGSFPSFSPDGARIAFVGLPGLFVVNSDGSGGPREVFSGNAFPTAWDWKRKGVIYTSHGPDFAGEGTKWVVFRSGRSGHKNLYVMDAVHGESASLRRLTEGPWTDTMCNWSPDGEWIAFSSDRDSPGSGSFAIYMVHPNGTGLRKVVQSGDGGRANHPWFSPDSKKLVFTSDYAGISAEPISNPHHYQPYGEIFTVNIDGSDIRRLTQNSYEDGTPTWTPFFLEPTDVPENLKGSANCKFDDCHWLNIKDQDQQVDQTSSGNSC